MPRREALFRLAAPDRRLPLEERFFQGLCLLGGLLTLFVVIPMNHLQGMVPWVNGLALCFGLGLLSLAWAARRGHLLRKTAALFIVGGLDLIWFPNGASQGSIGLFFLPVALFLVLYFEGVSLAVALGLLTADILALHGAEELWPRLAVPFQGPMQRLADVSTGYVISLGVSAFMLRVILAGLKRRNRDLKGALEAGRQSQANLAALLESTSDLVWSVDLDFRLLTFNSAFSEHFHMSYGVTAFLGALPGDVLPGERAALWKPLYGRALAEGPFRHEHRLLNGRVLELAFQPMVRDGEILGISVFGKDITERVRAEATLRVGAARLRSLLDTFPYAVWMKDAEGRFISVNRSFVEIFGQESIEDVLGKTDMDITVPELAAKYMADDRRVVDEGIRLDVEEEILDQGTLKWYETHKSPIRGEDGAIIGSAGFARDITERKRMEEERRRYEAQIHRNEKMESLGSLAGGVAHDMNNVLGAIMALASVHEADPGTALARDMETIAKACRRGGSLVKGLLSFARENLPEERELDLNAVVLDEVALLGRSVLRNTRLEMDLAPDLRPVKGDPAALGHALMNLCVNAVDALPEDGRLTLRTRNEDVGTVLLEVLDDGAGMSPEVLARAMDPFFTTKPQGRGTGLGLAIVYGTVKAHQGTMHIESEAGRGTSVSIRLPARGDASRLPEAGASQAGGFVPAVASRPLSVLLVDDDDLIQRSVGSMLRALGHAATLASEGGEALAALRNGLRPDIVILDLNMPGLDGAGTLPRLRALLPEVPVLLATGRADQGARDLAAACPGVTVMPKPYGLPELRAQLELVALAPSAS